MTSGTKRNGGWGPYLLLLIIGFTAAIGYLTKRSGPEDAPVVHSSHPAPVVKQVRCVRTGTRLDASTDLPTEVRESLEGENFRCAIWAEFEVDSNMTESTLERVAVKLQDAWLQDWPSFPRWHGRRFFVIVPKGYPEPRPLTVHLQLGPTRLALTPFPPLPKPQPVPIPAVTPGKSVAVSIIRDEMRPIPIAHFARPAGQNLLMAQLIGSTATESEMGWRESFVATGPKVPMYVGANDLPILLYYPKTTPAAFLRVREFTPIPFHERLHFRQALEFNAAGRLRVRTEASRQRLATGETINLMQGGIDGPNAAARPHVMVGGDRCFGYTDLTVIEPTHVKGVPLIATNSTWSALKLPTSHVATTPVAWNTGRSDVVIEISGMKYVPVRSTTLKVALPKPPVLLETR